MYSNLQKARKLKDHLVSLNSHEVLKAYDYADEDCVKTEREIETVMQAAILLHSLALFPQDSISRKDKNFIEGLRDFLLEQGKGTFSFGFWPRGSVLNKKFPIPDDLDDTALSLAALSKAGIEASEGYFLKIINQETDAGGPYRTWYLDFSRNKDKRWEDVDPVVNANLLYFVSLFGIRLFGAEKYIEERLDQSDFESPYYPYRLMFLFAVARYADASSNEEIRNKVSGYLEKVDFRELKRMEKLLFLLAVSYTGKKIDKSQIEEILGWEKNGFLPPLPVCFDFVSQSGKQTFTASRVMSTALALELLLKNLPAEKKSRRELPKSKGRKNEFFLEVLEQARLQLKKLDLKKTEIEIASDSKYERVIRAPVFTALSLKKMLKPDEEVIITNLALALYFSWLGYSLNDDIIDGQKSVRLKTLTYKLIETGRRYFETIFLEYPQFEREVAKAFRDSDSVYKWETANARFKTGSDLAQKLKRKWGYKYIEKRMSPFLVSMKNIPKLLKIDEKTGENIYRIFKAQMIIDQMNDDAHDWKEDKRKGFLTYVLYLLLKEEKNPKNQNIIFWEKTILEVIKICKKEYKSARTAIEELKGDVGFFSALIEKSYSPIRQIEVERPKIKQLIDYF